MPDSKLKIKINRAPVLTLWASVVAERLGYEHAEAARPWLKSWPD